LIEQGGVKLNQKVVTDSEKLVTEEDFDSRNATTLQVGKRKIVKLVKRAIKL